MTKPLITIFIVAFLLGNCAPVTISPPPLPIATNTSTLTPIPTPFVTPTITPYPGLQAQGPYLLFTKSGNEFTIMDPDGKGRKQFQLPNDGSIRELEPAVSPDGKWLAYFTGSNREPYDLALHVINLSNERSDIVAHLMAPGYPENLRPVAESLVLSDYRSECPSIECLTQLTSTIFEFGIASLAWSPNSQLLAFSAQIDGPSSDIYLYDTKSQTIHRLTDEIENIWQIEWSPTGEKILYHAAVPGPVEPYIYWYIADPKMNSPQSSRINAGDYYSVTRYGWITENSYLYALDTVFYEPVGPGPIFTSVRYINVENNETKEIWSYGAEDLTLDETNHSVILTTEGTDNAQVKAGTYLVSYDGSFTKLPDPMYRVVDYLESPHTFLGQDETGLLYGVSPSGEVKIPGMRPSTSPNKKWILIWETDTKLNLYSGDFKFVNSWSFAIDRYVKGYGVIWRLDSLGVILTTSAEYCYYLSIPGGSPELRNTGELNFFIWLP